MSNDKQQHKPENLYNQFSNTGPLTHAQRVAIANTTSNNKQRPPLGLMPHSVFLSRRLEEIFEAIERYYQANMQIPIEWITEYNLLIEMYKNNLGNNEQQ